MDEKVKKYIKYVIILKSEKTLNPEIIKEHISYLKSLDEKGIFVSGGPFADKEKGGMIIIKADNFKEANIIAKNDPFIENGYDTFIIREWLSACKENNFLL